LPEKDAAANALRGTADFLVHAKEHPEAALDLTSTAPIKLAITDGAKPDREALGPPPVLLKKAAPKAGPPRQHDPRAQLLSEAADDVVVPTASDESNTSIATPPIEFPLPDAFGSIALSGSSAWPSGNLIYYGPKYVVTLRGTSVEHVFDISGIRTPDPSSSVLLHLGHMELAGERLLLSFSHRGPSSELGGNKDFVAAFDRKTGAFLWKSDMLVSTMRFTSRGDYVISAWGNDGEPSSLFVIRVDTGETVSKLPLSPTPYELGWVGGDLVIENDGGAARYGVR
jgi:hypothetical protein